MKLSRYLCATALVGMFVGAPAAFAQTATNDTTADAATDVVVTGSRIRRPEVDSPVPVTVFDSAQIAASGQQNIADTLRELPQVGVGSSRTNTNFLTSGTGINTIDLRGLGSSRTLVLVNGRRFVSGFGGDTAVDINNIPTDFVERTEVITGGSSAVYGSDAVAGVVNFILKDKFEGIRVRAQTTITQEGDNPRQYASITGGTTWGADDRGNIMLNFSYDNDAGLSSRNRSISAQDCSFLVCGPASYSTYAAQGRFQLVGPNAAGDTLVGRNVYNGGSLFTFNPDNSLVAGFPTGYGYNRNNDRLISTPLQRYLVSGVANYDLTDGVQLFAEGTYGRVRSNSSLEPLALAYSDIYSGEVDDGGIPITNPFIPANVAAAIAAANSDANPNNNVTAVQFRRRQNGIFNRSNDVQRDTWRAVVGLRGDIGSKFHYEASYVYGHLRDYNASQDIDNQRYRQALNAVRVGTGNVVGTDIVCADAAAVAAGCIPINLFGYNTADPRAAEYVRSVVPKSEEIVNTQHVANISLSGTPFSLWAGDVGFAIGAEYRKEKVVDDLDILTNTGGNSGNQIPDLRGQQDVKEVFGEVSVPLLRDTILRSVELTGAARYSKYSTIGSVFSWNGGATIEPFRGLRLRGVYAVANRAPNNTELFGQPAETFASVSDPCDGVTASNDLDGYGAACRAIPAIANAIRNNGVFEYTLADIQGINGFVGGNTALKEEKAKTFTLGAVIAPDFLPGLSFTVDYYDIQIDGAISTIGRTYSIQQCVKTGLPVYCGNVFRSATTGLVTRVDGQSINVAALKNRGIDLGAKYNGKPGILNGDQLLFSANYTHLFENSNQPDPAAEKLDYAGTFGLTTSSDRFRVNAIYGVEGVSLSWTTTFVSGGDYVLDFVNADPAVSALNKVKDYWLHNAQLRFDVAERMSFFLGVDNVFNRKPQYLPGTPFGTPTGLETSADFDVIGRRFTAGTTFTF